MALTRSAHRWIAGGVVALALIGALLGAEGVTRAAVQAQLDQSAPAGVHVAPSGSAAWGLVTGSLAVSLTVDETAIAAAMQDRVDDVRIDDRIHVTVSRPTPWGEIPVDVTLVPVVAAGRLTVEVVAVRAGGIDLPPDLVATGFSLDQTLVEDSCLDVQDASVQDGRLVLHGELPAGFGGARGC